MNIKNYDRVIEVKKHEKQPWYKKCLEFSIESNMEFMSELYDSKKNYYLCEKEQKVYLVDSDNHKNEISWIDLTKFVEVEIEDFIYRKYRELK
ncbi:hypothetical protein [Gemella cuniculi]|uniref:hypothetical protein n=1 Tax=Gemella cuniculi TaxID=150240 RepID=UPI00040C1595|nr:hypothetical protein [Gemella cuniculi]